MPKFTNLVSSGPGLKAKAAASTARVPYNHIILTSQIHCSHGYAEFRLFRKQNAYGSRVFVQEKKEKGLGKR